MTGLEAATAIRDHHAQLQEGLTARVLALRAVLRDGRPHASATEAVIDFLDRELLPHAAAEEATLYRAADVGSAALLVTAMRNEHRDIVSRVDALRAIGQPLEAATAASAILALFESHLAKENDLLVPALLARPEVSLAELLAGMHELVG